MKQIQFNNPNLFAPKDAWGKLSLAAKAEMMKVAVKNGIYDLQTIRNKYNEFAEGGDIPQTDWSYDSWKKQIALHKGIDIDSDRTYDYEGFFRKYPQEAWAMLSDNPDAHFSDEFKTVYHPTFSAASQNNDGSIYSGVKHPIFNPEGLKGGIWSPDYKSFTMSIDGYRGPVSMDERKWYLENAEDKGVQLREADGSLPIYDGVPWAGVLPTVTVTGKKHSIGGPLVYYLMNEHASGGKIHIKPKNRGKFTALKERTGHSATWFKEHGTPAQKKMAVFALNSRKWKHGDGGNLFLTGGHEEDGRSEITNLSIWDEFAANSPLFYTIGKALDPTGITGWGDAKKAIGQYDNNPSIGGGYNAVMETVGAIPLISKAGKAIRFIQGLVTGQGAFNDYNYAKEQRQKYGDELVIDYWDNTVKPRREAEKHAKQIKAKMSYEDVNHVPSFRLAPKGSKSGDILKDYNVNSRIVNKYKHGLGGNLFDGTSQDSQQLVLGKKYWQQQAAQPQRDYLAEMVEYNRKKEAERQQRVAALRRELAVRGEQIAKKKQKEYLTMSNDNTWVEKNNGREKNPHLAERAIEGAKAHAAWAEEHPVLNTLGMVAGAAPFAVMATPVLSAAGEAAYPIITNPFVDALGTSYLGADGIKDIANGEADAFTALEVLPMTRLIKPIFGNQERWRKAIYRNMRPYSYSKTLKALETPSVLFDYFSMRPLKVSEETVLPWQKVWGWFDDMPKVTDKAYGARRQAWAKYLGMPDNFEYPIYRTVGRTKEGREIVKSIPENIPLANGEQWSTSRLDKMINDVRKSAANKYDDYFGDGKYLRGNHQHIYAKDLGNDTYYFNDTWDLQPLFKYKSLPQFLREFEFGRPIGGKPFEWSEIISPEVDFYNNNVIQQYISHIPQ